MKVFNDPVHGHIEMHPLHVKIIDTPQFQRLRYLKQLGACYFVYPGAAHNRFEHCIGVCHLAGKLVKTLKKRQPNLGITKEDVLCVEIAGLCHDLGHGPFSHLFDGMFIPSVRPRRLKWRHEEASVAMFDHMIATNKLRKHFRSSGLTNIDIEFIKELIAGSRKNPGKISKKRCRQPASKENSSDSTSRKVRKTSHKKEVWPYRGRTKSKEFLYEIVANKRNEIDADKWDYFARDCHGLGIKNNFDHLRFIKFARVIKVDKSLQICSRDKEADTLYSMFHIRATLHKRAYQHRVCTAIETMITDAFIHADKTKIVPGKDGELFSISECIDDLEAYTNLNDSIFHVLLMSDKEDLKESRHILQRIQRRELYRCVGETSPTEGKTEDDDEKIRQEIMCHLPKRSRHKLCSHDLDVTFVNFDYGAKTENSIKHVRFYNKKYVNRAFPLAEDQVSLMLPKRFSEQLIRLYCKKTDDESIELATDCFKKWCDDKGLSLK